MGIVELAVHNLNRVLDVNRCPTEASDLSSRRHRVVGLGVQGLADVFMMMGLPYDSVEARDLNKGIFETIYFAALDASCNLAARDGPHYSYAGSPADRGILQFDLWDVRPSSDHNWDGLQMRIKQHGLHNSLLVAPMLTASTSQILGCNECFEPFTRCEGVILLN